MWPPEVPEVRTLQGTDSRQRARNVEILLPLVALLGGEEDPTPRRLSLHEGGHARGGRMMMAHESAYAFWGVHEPQEKYAYDGLYRHMGHEGISFA